MMSTQCSKHVEEYNNLIIKQEFVLDWSVYTYLTQPYGGRDMYNLLHKNNYMFRPFSLTIFKLISEKLSKQLHSTCVGCIQWGGKRLDWVRDLACVV